MKFWKRISLFLLYPALLMAAGFYGGYAFDQYFYPGKTVVSKGNVQVEPLIQESEEETKLKAQEALPVVEQKDTITEDTIFLVENYDLVTREANTEKGKMPEQYVGMDREQFLESMVEYGRGPSAEDAERGFVSLEVQRFSSQLVQVRKNYRPQPQEGYYLLVQSHYIMVYEADKKTLFLPTDIVLESLPESLQREIIAGKRMTDEQEVYNFLESYSS